MKSGIVFRAGMVFLFGLSLGGAVKAQSTRAEGGDSKNVPNDTRRLADGQSKSDRRIAQWIAVLNEAEIELTQYAGGRLQLRANRRWVEDLEADHQRLARSLRRYIAGESISRPAQPAENGGEGAESDVFDFHGASRDVLDQTVRNLRRELRSQHGLDFDWMFLGQQAILQGEMAAEIKALQAYASPAFQHVLSDARDNILDHQDDVDRLLQLTKRAEIRRRLDVLKDQLSEAGSE